jgi:hypothetical protein
MPEVDFTQFDQMREEAHAEETAETVTKNGTESELKWD